MKKLPLLCRADQLTQAPGGGVTTEDDFTIEKNRGRLVALDFLLQDAPTALLNSTITVELGGENVIEQDLVGEYYYDSFPFGRQLVNVHSSGGQTLRTKFSNNSVATVADSSILSFYENRFNTPSWWKRFKRKNLGLKSRTYNAVVSGGFKGDPVIDDVLPVDQGDCIGLQIVCGQLSATQLNLAFITIRIDGVVIIQRMPAIVGYLLFARPWIVFPIGIPRGATFEVECDASGTGSQIEVGVKFYFDDSGEPI